MPSKNADVDTENVVEGASIPHQNTPKHENTEVDVEESENLSLGDKVKKLVKNKKIVGGVSAAVLVAAGVFFAKTRSATNDSEGEDDSL